MVYLKIKNFETLCNIITCYYSNNILSLLFWKSQNKPQWIHSQTTAIKQKYNNELQLLLPADVVIFIILNFQSLLRKLVL